MAAAAPLPPSMAAPQPPALSVILPVYNAMPYLTVCIRDVLRQEVDGGLELICAWDGGDVDAWLDRHATAYLVTRELRPPGADPLVRKEPWVITS